MKEVKCVAFLRCLPKKGGGRDDWGDGSVVKTLVAPADLSSVPSTYVTVPGDPMPSFGLHTVYILTKQERHSYT